MTDTLRRRVCAAASEPAWSITGALIPSRTIPLRSICSGFPSSITISLPEPANYATAFSPATIAARCIRLPAMGDHRRGHIATDRSWTGIRLQQKRADVLPFSHARSIMEIYDLDAGYFDWRTSPLGASRCVVRLYCPHGRTRLESFEPYCVRYLRVIVRRARAFTLHDVFLRRYQYPDLQGGTFLCSDGKLNRIYEAARLTLRACGPTRLTCSWIRRGASAAAGCATRSGLRGRHASCLATPGSSGRYWRTFSRPRWHGISTATCRPCIPPGRGPTCPTGRCS